MNKQDYIDGILSGDNRILSKAITLAESQLASEYDLALEIIEQLPKVKTSQRIGITGSPGAGKSTFIDSFGNYLLQKKPKEKIAVLSIDPSSSISGGSILGDKTRMHQLSQDPRAYIRPTASGTQLGGIARSSRLVVLLCEAAGYHTLFIESVGVGQAETELSKLCDLFLLLLNPGGGDELQGIKRGIVEMADLLLVNKEDGGREDLVKQTVKDYQMALHIGNQASNKVLSCSSLEGKGFDAVSDSISDFFSKHPPESREQQRQQHQFYWASKQLKELAIQHLKSKEEQLHDSVSKGQLAERAALELAKELFG